MKDLTICTVQFDILWENPEGNYSKLETLFSKINTGVDLIILPEMFTTGFAMDAKKIAEKYDVESMQSLNWMRKIAEKYQSVVTGSIAIEDGGLYHNRLFWVKPSGEHSYYDKHNLFAFAGEDKDYSCGNSHLIEQINGWNIMLLICFDLRFPIWSRNTIINKKTKYDLLIYVANWPEKRRSHWQKLLEARAIENQTFVAGINRIGGDENGLTYVGDSTVVNYLGDIIAKHKDNRESLIIQKLSKKGLEIYREKFPVLV